MGSWRVQRTMLNLPHDGVAEFEQSLEDALKSHMFINFLNPDRVEVVAMTFTPSITERMDNDMIVSYDEMEDHLAEEATAMLKEVDEVEAYPAPTVVADSVEVDCSCGDYAAAGIWHSKSFPCRPDLSDSLGDEMEDEAIGRGYDDI